MASHILTKGRKGHVYNNYCRTVQCTPELYFEPENVEELRQILSAARLNQKKVKVVGKGHSFSKLPVTKDYMVSLVKMNKVTKIDVDTGTVAAEAGITLTDLNQALANEGLVLAVLPVVTDLTLAGAISTGAHGSGAKFRSMSSYVLEIDLLTASGEILSLSRAADAETFGAACLSLGALGLILSVKMQCEPKFDLNLVMHDVQLKDVLENMDVYSNASDYFSFHWYAHTEGAVVCHLSRTTKPPLKLGFLMFVIASLRYHFMEFLLWLSTFFPIVAIKTSQFYFGLSQRRIEIISPGNQLLKLNWLMTHNAFEWAIPRDKTALVMYELKEWITKHNYPVHSPVVIRLAQADDIPMSPAYKTDVCYVNICVYRPYGKLVEQSDLTSAFQQMALNAGGRMHWAKIPEETYPHVRTMYGNCLDSFLKIRERLDPEGMFLNEALCELFSVGDSSSN